jgi:hypothetical protein
VLAVADVETHPLPVCARVRHSGQQWPRARTGTATVLEVQGPDHRGEYEYLVDHDGSFSGGEPKAAPSWWASYRTIPASVEAPA